MGNGKWEMGNGKWEIENGKLVIFLHYLFMTWNKFFSAAIINTHIFFKRCVQKGWQDFLVQTATAGEIHRVDLFS